MRPPGDVYEQVPIIDPLEMRSSRNAIFYFICQAYNNYIQQLDATNVFNLFEHEENIYLIYLPIKMQYNVQSRFVYIRIFLLLRKNYIDARQAQFRNLQTYNQALTNKIITQTILQFSVSVTFYYNQGECTNIRTRTNARTNLTRFFKY